MAGNDTIEFGYERNQQALMSPQLLDKLRLLISRKGGFKHVADCSGVVQSLWADESLQ